METEALTDEERDIIRHSLGINYPRVKRPKPYRNYYCATTGDTRLVSLANRGLMEQGRSINDGECTYYYVTEAGAKAVGSRLPKDD